MCSNRVVSLRFVLSSEPSLTEPPQHCWRENGDTGREDNTNRRTDTQLHKIPTLKLGVGGPIPDSGPGPPFEFIVHLLSELSKNESFASALLEGESKAASQAATKQTYTVSAMFCHVQGT